MLTEQLIAQLVNEVNENTPVFLVDVVIKPTLKIFVMIDSFEGLLIDDCGRVSKYIESKIDGEKYDFSLEVSSPGVGNPFKVVKQYEKAIGKNVEITNEENKKIQGKLLEISETEVKLEVKKKKTEIEIISIPFNQIKKTNYQISFK